MLVLMKVIFSIHTHSLFLLVVFSKFLQIHYLCLCLCFDNCFCSAFFLCFLFTWALYDFFFTVIYVMMITCLITVSLIYRVQFSLTVQLLCSWQNRLSLVNICIGVHATLDSLFSESGVVAIWCLDISILKYTIFLKKRLSIKILILKSLGLILSEY